MIQRPFLTLAAAFLAFAVPLHAQSYSLPDGTSVPPLFTLPTDHTIGGLDVDSVGDIFYLDVNYGSSDTELVERTAAGQTRDLYSLTNSSAPNDPLYGAFVRLQGSDIYFGYGAASVTTIGKGVFGAGGTLQVTPDFAALTGAYDLAFSPLTGAAYLSASMTAQENAVYLFNTSDGTTQLKIDTSGDYSGPIAIDSAGSLYYGSSGSTNVPGGLYRFTASELAGNATLTLPGHQVASNAGNESLAVLPDGRLLQDSFSSGDVTAYAVNDAQIGASIAGTSPDSPGFLAAADGQTYVAVTQYDYADNSATSALFAVPEPSAAGWLGGVALVAALRRRR